MIVILVVIGVIFVLLVVLIYWGFIVFIIKFVLCGGLVCVLFINLVNVFDYVVKRWFGYLLI